MDIEKIRYFLTNYKEKNIFTYENYQMLIHPSLSPYKDLILQIEDDIRLMPRISKTGDKTPIKFYLYDYDKDIYSKSEILAFIYAAINPKFTIIEGLDKENNSHFYLKLNDIIFDPSLSIITKEYIYNQVFNFKEAIKPEDLTLYLEKNNNLAKYYKKEKQKYFSLTLISSVKRRFKRNVEEEYTLDPQKYAYLKSHFMTDNFILLRSILTHARQSYLKSSNIALYPTVNPSILFDINEIAPKVCVLMKTEYNQNWSYFTNTYNNCYGLSIMFSLFDSSFKLVQGGIYYERKRKDKITKYYFQHSWLEKDNYVYDPALRIVTLKELYYIFFQKQKEYSKEETESILRRIGFNLTHFEDFLNGKQIGGNMSIMYRNLLKKVDSPEMKEQGEDLLKLVRKYNN